jgi:MinD-like ATPase involved in chromosome partitioning or flagellar assembly
MSERPRYNLSGTTAGGPRRETGEETTAQPADRTEPAAPATDPAPPRSEPRRSAPAPSRFRREDVYSRPVVDGREVGQTFWERMELRIREVLTSSGERAENEVDSALASAVPATRTNVIAVVSPKGGVGKTTTTFVVGNLLAESLNRRVIAIDANRDFGTLSSLAPDAVRSRHSLADLLPHTAHIDSVSDVLPYVSQLRSGLHVLAAPEQAEVMAEMTPEAYGSLLDLLSRFYEIVLLDLGTGIVDPLAQFGIRRADQALLVTTPEFVTAEKVLGALRYLSAEAGWNSGPEEESLNRKRLTVVLNRAPSEGSGDRKVIEDAFRRLGIAQHVTIPFDDRLRVMLDSATYDLGGLGLDTRLPIKSLGRSVVERLI